MWEEGLQAWLLPVRGKRFSEPRSESTDVRCSLATLFSLQVRELLERLQGGDRRGQGVMGDSPVPRVTAHLRDCAHWSEACAPLEKPPARMLGSWNCKALL